MLQKVHESFPEVNHKIYKADDDPGLPISLASNVRKQSTASKKT